jgi:signal transduction histidine kinase
VEKDVEIRDPVTPAAATPDPGSQRSREAEARARLMSAYALYCADEALSLVRHDVLNRITAVGALSYELRQQLADAPPVPRQRLEDINRQIGMLTEVVGRRLASPTDPRAGAPLDEALQLLSSLLPGPVSASFPPGQRAPMAPLDLQVVLLAVLSNAAENGQLTGDPAVTLRAGWSSEDRLLIEVDDRGPAMSEETRERCFERFYTTRPGRAGLGLSVARTLVLRAGGEITVFNRSDGGRPAGVRVCIHLPGGGRRGGRA